MRQLIILAFWFTKNLIMFVVKAKRNQHKSQTRFGVYGPGLHPLSTTNATLFVQRNLPPAKLIARTPRCLNAWIPRGR